MPELSKVIDVTFIFLCVVTVWVGACSSSSGQKAGELMVIRKTDSESNKLIVELGEDAMLFCRTNAPWKKCYWRPPRSGVKQLRCLFNSKEKKRIACPSFPEVQYDEEASAKGGPHHCAIVIRKVNEYHEGNWKCEFELEGSTKDNPLIVWEKVRLDARGNRAIPEAKKKGISVKNCKK